MTDFDFDREAFAEWQAWFRDQRVHATPTITQETIRFTVGYARHPGQSQADANACRSCNLEAKEIETALERWLSEQSVEIEATPEPKPRGVCRWHPWGCPKNRGYYEGPRQTLAGPPLI